jgi:hypothetical protein
MIQIMWSDGVETKLRPHKEVPLDGQDDRVQNIPLCISKHIQGVPGGKDLTSGEWSLGQTISI